MRDRVFAERLDRFAAAWARCDLEELGSYLAGDVVYSPLCGEVVRGHDAVIRRFAEVLAADSSGEISFEPAIVSGSLGVTRWRQSVPTEDGGAFEVQGIDVYALTGNRIRCVDVYTKA
jgi:ketosteroid isomerase-like protein